MQRAARWLCAAALAVGVFAAVAAVGAPIFWEGLFLVSAALILLAGIARIAETNPRLLIGTLALLALTYPLQSFSFRSEAPLAPESSGAYQFTSDWATMHYDLWNKTLKTLKGKPGIHALEVGSYEGRSAIWFLENILTDPSSSITCVDIFDGPFEAVFDTNMASFAGKVKKIKAPSQDALKKMGSEAFDFIYIDGSHVAKNVFMDAALSWDLLKPGGILIFDDYRWNIWDGHRLGAGLTPKIAIDSFLKVFEPYIEVQHKGYQVIIQKRREPDPDSPQLRRVRLS